LDPTLCARIREALESFRPPGGSVRRGGETYVKIKGRWACLYGAVDKEGKTVDFLLRVKWGIAAAKAFFRRACRRQGATAP
jgi:transposase-like protein